jgi:hemin uptake protein HemP
MDDQLLQKLAPIETLSPDAKADGAAREAWRSEELLGDRSEVLIVHNNEIYRLRRTRQGKLILYK